MRSLCGRDWNPSEVLLSRRRPRDPAPWVRHFRAPIRFDAGQSAIDFPSHWLEHRLPSADSMLHQHLVAEADALHLRNDDGPVGDVRRLVHSAMARGGKCTADGVATQLGMHERTLNRRLQSDGTTFHRQLDAVRHEVSLRLLSTTAMRLAEIAATLGYADASAFVRAFRRWSGTTPEGWQRAHDSAGRSNHAVR